MAGITFLAAGLALLVVARDQKPGGPTPSPSAVEVKEGDYQFKVDVDPNGRISLHSLGKKSELPPKLSLSLFSDDEIGQTVELHAVAPPENRAPPLYQGKVDWYNGPYVAFELQFSLPEQGTRRIRIEGEAPR